MFPVDVYKRQILGASVNGMMGGYGALMAEAYPTTARATAQNVLFNICLLYTSRCV